MKIFVNGTFDVLHPGHVALLNYARGLGSYLLVAIDSDRRVRELKGNTRPFFDQHQRQYLLENLKSVDQVVTFDSADELEQIIKTYSPDVMVKGSDYLGQSIVGEHLVPQIEFFERINEFSSTQTIQHLTNR